MHLFFAENINLENNTFLLIGEEAHHCNVLRINKNEIVGITDGTGILIIAKLLNRKKEHCLLEVIEIIKDYHKRNYYLHIAIAPPKSSDRLEFFVEKAIEFGIDRITPIYTRRTERKKIKQQRLEKIAIAAMKQSKNTFKPQIDPLINFQNFFKLDLPQNRFIALCQAQNRLFDTINKKIKKYVIIIGPEGGFEQQEINLAIEKKFKPIKLTNNILRTETAAIFAAANFILKF